VTITVGNNIGLPDTSASGLPAASPPRTRQLAYRKTNLRSDVRALTAISFWIGKLTSSNKTERPNRAQCRPAAERRIEFRVGIHLGDVVEEADGDLMGDGVNIAARLEGVAAPGAVRRAPSVSPRTPIVRLAAGSTWKSPISARPAQEHRKIDSGLFAASGRPCRGEGREGARTPRAVRWPRRVSPEPEKSRG